MKILFGSCQHVSVVGPAGGVRTQILKTKEYLEKLGHEVALFDQWNKLSIGSYDIFHLFFTDLSTNYLALMAKEANMKLVVSPIIDRVMPHFFIKSTNYLIRKLPKLYSNLSVGAEICAFADLVIARSHEELDRAVNSFGIDSSKVTIVPNGVDMEFLDPDPSLFINKYKMKDFILTVGLIGESRKNYLRFIRVVGNLNIPTVFIGAIRNTSYAKTCLKEAQGYKNIYILGFVDKPVLLSAYAAAGTFVLPSIVEGTGLVALEAGLAGSKVVITKNGGPHYYFQNFVEYINPISSKSINTKIKKSLQNKKNTDLKEHIKKNFTWEIVAQKMIEAYESIL